MCGEMVTLYEGVEEEELAKLARDFFESKVESRIFPEMRELTRMLAEAGCEMWAVSSTNEWVVRAGAKRFGIPQERVLAACAVCDGGRVTGRLKWVPTGEDKARVIKTVLKAEVDVAFGNSIHDAAMLAMAKHAFAINPNPDLEQIAKLHGWAVHKPTR
jgi:phosphoserine phosphatase